MVCLMLVYFNMVNAQADALEWVQIGGGRIGEAREPRKKDDL